MPFSSWQALLTNDEQSEGSLQHPELTLAIWYMVTRISRMHWG